MPAPEQNTYEINKETLQNPDINIDTLAQSLNTKGKKAELQNLIKNDINTLNADQNKQLCDKTTQRLKSHQDILDAVPNGTFNNNRTPEQRTAIAVLALHTALTNP
jgi:hypothetical protein